MDFLYTTHIVFILVLVVTTHFLGVRRPNKVFLSRKILHIGAISAVSHATLITPQAQLPLFKILILSAAVLLTMAVFKGFFEIDGRKSWGIAYFPWVLLLMLLFQPGKSETIAISFLVLAVSDGLSALAGRYIKLPGKWEIRNAAINGKTWLGFITFVLSAWFSLIVIFGSQLLEKNDGSSLNTALLSLFIIALTAAMVELISKKGTDNLWLPLWVFLLLVWISRLGFLMSLFANYIPIVAIIAFVVWRKKWLSIDGLFTAILLALVVVMANVNMVPLLIFFLLGSLASKINKNINSDSKHGKPRDMWQVLANGGWVGFLALIKGVLIERGYLGGEDLDYMVLIVMSAALGDTLSSEIGMRWGKNPIQITTGKRVPVGLSGGISLAGTLGALLGGLVMSIYALTMFEVRLAMFLDLLIAALGGSIIDSLLGDCIQEKFEHNGQLRDVGLPNNRISGIVGINNDAINFISLGIIMIFFICWKF